jgi:hypothetical protein
MISNALEFLELFEKLHELVEAQGIRDQTLWLVAGLLVIALLGMGGLRKVLSMLRESAGTTAQVADERDEFEELIFEKKGARANSEFS